ncbi:MAG TPA: DUF4365 domain-containing protein [Streptosporangiaceae bacterium]|nr:DUF4365 domain-containing protein [Streptosporangiaceae bacterium]
MKGPRPSCRGPGPGGWWFRPDAEHVRYWKEHSLPVVVVLYDPETEYCYWQHVSPETLVETSSSGWKLLIPEAQVCRAYYYAETVPKLFAWADSDIHEESYEERYEAECSVWRRPGS